MGKFIPLSVPNLKGKELEYVTKAVEDEWVSTGGEFINKFENNMAEYLNVEKAVACQSGTAALHLALILSGVNHGDEVIVPTLTFIAAVNPVRYIGAHPIFMDCDDTLTMDPNKLEEFCKEKCYVRNGNLINKETGRAVKALVVVHVFGNLTDMEKIMKIAEDYNLKVIEDSTEALGTYYTEGCFKGKFAGTIGDFGAYSFNGNKIITTGGGGMLVAKNAKDADRAKHLSTQAKSDGLYYIHDEIGFNYRMTNLQAAMGVAQLERLEEFIQIKKENYELYKTEIEAIPGLSIMDFRSGIRPNYWFYSLLIDSKVYPLNRDQLLKYLGDNGIQTRPIWGLISDQKPYSESQTYKLELSKYYIEHILNIPCSSSLTREDVITVIEFLKQVK
ncbi:LegC family aminotransferase [Clostridium fungisolvens]|uniref:UDP-N-acetylbacillosamine transaminase n=1 Tax=Clostridium fungisolvens TaxID=1604897 RepID=A0A6V8SIS4_9CLOT|nr:LegC family aminotransferase [Clostridium fungisolvens]GFP77107.1 UDP-N-acetylbacillosamine transaminase [Clostridium fungisolvens]